MAKSSNLFEWNWSSVKKKFAPFFYIILHALMLTLLHFTTHLFILNTSYALSTESLFLWIAIGISFFLFFILIFRDPGYVDQKQTPKMNSYQLEGSIMNTNAGPIPFNTQGANNKQARKEIQLLKSQSIKQPKEANLYPQFLRTISGQNQVISRGKSLNQDDLISEMISQSRIQQPSSVPQFLNPSIKLQVQSIQDNKSWSKMSLDAAQINFKSNENFSNNEKNTQNINNTQIPFPASDFCAISIEEKSGQQFEQGSRLINGISVKVSEPVPPNHSENIHDAGEKGQKEQIFCQECQIQLNFFNSENKNEEPVNIFCFNQENQEEESKEQEYKIDKQVEEEEEEEEIQSDRLKSYREDSQSEQSQQISMDNLNDEEYQSQNQIENQQQQKDDKSFQVILKSCNQGEDQKNDVPQSILENLSEHNYDQEVCHKAHIKNLREKIVMNNTKMNNRKINEVPITLPQDQQLNSILLKNNNVSAQYPFDYIINDENNNLQKSNKNLKHFKYNPSAQIENIKYKQSQIKQTEYQELHQNQVESIHQKQRSLSTTNIYFPFEIDQDPFESQEKRTHRSKTLPSPKDCENMNLSIFLNLLSPSNQVTISPHYNLTSFKASQNNSYDLAREQLLLSPILNVDSVNFIQQSNLNSLFKISPHNSKNNIAPHFFRRQDEEQLSHLRENKQNETSINNSLYSNAGKRSNSNENSNANNFFASFKINSNYQQNQIYNNIVPMPNIKSLKASEHQKFNCSNVSLTQPKNNQKLSTKIEDDCNSQEECDQGSNPNKPLSSIIKLSPSTSTLQTDKKLISSIKDQPFLSNHHRFYDFNKFQKNEIRLKRNHPHLKRSASSIDNQFKKKEQSNEAQIKSSNIKRDILIQDLILNKQKTLELPKNIHRRFFRSKTRSGVIHTFCGTSDCPKESYDFGEHSQQGILMKKKSSLCYPSQQSLSYLARGSPSNNNYNQFEIQLLSNEEQIGYAEEGNKDFNPSFIKSRNHSHSLFFGKIDKNTILEEIDKESNEIIKTSKSDFKNQQNTTPSILNLDQKINSSEQNKGSKNLQICITQPIAEIKGEDNARLASQPNLRLNSSTQAAKVSNLKPNHNIQLSAESFNLSNYAQNAAYQSCNNSLNNSNNNFFVRKLNAQLKQTRVQSPTITTSTVLDQPDFKDQKDHVLQNKISFQIPDLNSGILEKGTQKENNIENNLMTNYTINIGNYFEKRYCQICRIDQPTRSKHCLICKRCVSTFDHHCPWIGVCIAQRNRIYFLFFVTIQNMSVVLCFLKLMVFLQKQWSGKSEQFLVGVVLSSIAVVFLLYTFLMTFLLIVQHIYYISKNITTWEYYSWEKITYLKEQPKRLGSPFSFGTRKNIQLFIQSSFFSLPYEWQINKLRLPAVLNN